MARTRAPALSSWIETWMVILPTGRPMSLSMILTPSKIRNSLKQLWAKAILLASIVDRSVSVCNLDCHMIGQLATTITYPVMLVTQTGSSIASCLYIATKLASRKLSKQQEQVVIQLYTAFLSHTFDIPDFHKKCFVYQNFQILSFLWLSHTFSLLE